MLSAEEWWGILEAYGAKVWPAQAVFFVAGVLIVLMVFLAIEGSDTVGEKIYLAIRFYDIYTYLLLGLFFFCSWLIWDKRSASLYEEGILI